MEMTVSMSDNSDIQNVLYKSHVIKTFNLVLDTRLH